MKKNKRKTLSSLAVIIAILPILTKSSTVEMLGNNLQEKKAIFAWDIEKTNHRHNYKIKRETKKKS